MIRTLIFGVQIKLFELSSSIVSHFLLVSFRACLGASIWRRLHGFSPSNYRWRSAGANRIDNIVEGLMYLMTNAEWAAETENIQQK
jgi:hypothetical protein